MLRQRVLPRIPKPDPNSGRVLRIAALVAAVCGGLYGYDTGIISGALLSITDEFHLDHRMQEIVVASILAGAVIGALATSWLSERIGRKRAVMTVTAAFTFGAVACALAPDIGTLIAARVLLGIAVGGSTQVVPMYISELAPHDKRGNLVTMFNVAIGVGIVLAALVSFGLRDVWSWRGMVAVAAIPSAAVLVAMAFMPGSPRWLAENVGMEAAIDVLRQVRGTKREIRRELGQMNETMTNTRSVDTGWRGLRRRWVRPALVAALGVAFFTQCGGLETMIYYAPTFLSGAGFGESSALAASVGVAVVYAVMTLLGCLFVDRIGRRRLMLVMIPGSVLSLVGLGMMFASDTQGHWQAWATIGFLLSFMMFNAGGIQVCGWLLGAEMFPLAMRGPATALHAATLWGTNLVITGTALSLVHALGLGMTMWVYAGLNLLSFVFVWFVVPETTGASLEDIEAALRNGSFAPRRGDTAIAAAG